MRFGSFMAAAALAVFAQGAGAGEAGYDFLVCTHGRGIPVEGGAEVVAFGVENWGVVASSATRDWDNASTHCVGYLRLVAGQRVGRGVCGWMLANGDTAVGEFEYSGTGEPRFTWLGGTGGLQGISGGGSFREIAEAPQGDLTAMQGCRRDFGRYTVPTRK